jgi:hypothetical protein
MALQCIHRRLNPGHVTRHCARLRLRRTIKKGRAQTPSFKRPIIPMRFHVETCMPIRTLSRDVFCRTSFQQMRLHGVHDGTRNVRPRLAGAILSPGRVFVKRRLWDGHGWLEKLAQIVSIVYRFPLARVISTLDTFAAKHRETRQRRGPHRPPVSVASNLP